MRLLKNIKLLTSIRIYISLLFSIMFIASGVFFYFEGRRYINKKTETEYSQYLDELSEIVEMQIKRDKDLLEMAKNVAEHKINEYSDIVEKDDEKINIKAVDPFTKKTIEIALNEWYVDGIPLLSTYSLVDQVAKLTRLEVSIYQKSDKGYINSSTSILSSDNERMIGDMLLNSSPIIQTIEKGNEYTGRIFKNGSWYLTVCKHISIEGKIKGLYYIGIKQRLGRSLNKVFDKKQYQNTGFAFISTLDGKIVTHSKLQGIDFSKTSFFKKLKRDKPGVIKYRWPDNKDGDEWEMHYRFHKSTQNFIGITYPVKEKYSTLLRYSIYGTISFIIFILSFQFFYTIANKSLRQMLKKLQKILKQIATGKIASRLEIESQNEFFKLSENVNVIVDRYNDLANFANGLANDNYGQVYPKSLIGDNVGEALIKINEKLNDAMYNENIRQKEEKLRAWESEGLSKFVNILQRNRDNLEELCYDLISNLVEFLNADLGALFFLNNDNASDLYFEQMATYAFDEKKITQKKIYPEQGLIGRIFNEKETIYLSEVPENYINISTGLGKGSPKNLLIVPLLINKEVHGAIEIASFNLIKGFQIEFIEKIAENIASTINNVLVNNRTKELLKQSRKQSELLSSQEEEMRKNLQELKQIQAESEASKLEISDKLKHLEHLLLVLEIDSKGKILFVNDNIPEFFAMKKENLINRNYSDYSSYVPVDEYKNLINSWERIKNNTEVQTDLKVKNGYGVMTKILINIIPQFKDEILDKIVILGIELRVDA